jgi:hypothetical protein
MRRRTKEQIAAQVKANTRWRHEHPEHKVVKRVVDNRHYIRRRDAFQANKRTYFEEHPCVDCGNEDYRVLDFDHIGKKEFNIAEMWTKPWAEVLIEISKCVVRCANCHRIRHWNEAH